MEKVHELAKKIKLVIFDVDGVLTDGMLYYVSDNTEMKAFNVQDGLGIQLLQRAGIQTAIITAKNTSIVAQRAETLKIQHVYQGNMDKIPAYEDLLKKLNLPDEAVAYIGDDLVDLPILKRVGLAVAVANATTPVKEAADWVTTKNGGHGAVRELCEMILKAQNKLESVYKTFLA